MFTCEYADIGELEHELTARLVYGQPDVINATDTQIHDVMVRAASCEYDSFDLKKVWLTENRWGALINQYLDPAALDAWMKLITEKLTGPRNRGVAFMRTQTVKTQVNATTGREWRRWGSCLLGFSYRARPRPVLSLHSRTTYLGYIAQVDLALAAILAREICERLRIVGPSDVEFVWHLEAGQFHAFKSLAWFFSDEYGKKMLLEHRATPVLRKKHPTLWMARRTLEKFEQEDEADKGYGDHNFNQMLRIRRRYHAEVTGTGKQFVHGTNGKTSKRNHEAFEPLPSVPLSDLSLDKIFTRRDGDPDNAGLLEDL